MLTPAQRALLDDAVAKRTPEDISSSLEAAEGWLHGSSPPRAGKPKPKPHKKKPASSAGRGTTWGTVFDSVKTPVYALGEGDPNFDEDEQGNVELHEAATPANDRVSDYKHQVSCLLDEYWTSSSTADAVAALGELAHPLYAHYFVKRAVATALDRGPREKEQVALLLSAAYPSVIAADQMAKGFTKLLEAAAELALDVPDAPGQLALFIARAVVDDVLPPAFVASAAETLPASAVAGHEALRLAKSHLSARRPGAAVLAAWGEQAAGTLADAKAAVRRTLADYFAGGTAAEACAALAALHVPFFAHEAVKKALVAALEERSRLPAALTLLATLRDTGGASTQQLARGFARAAEALDDLSLDVPDAKRRWAELRAAALAQGLLRRGAADVAASASAADGVDDASAALAAFKAAASDVIWEYFAAGSRDEAAARLAELLVAAPPGCEASFGAAFARRLVLHALDRGAREREGAAQLLAALAPAVLPRAAVAAGFQQLLGEAEDVALDVPDAPEQLLLFVVRAVVDDVLPPAWPRAAAGALEPGCAGAEVARAAAAALSARHVAERALRAWGGPDAGTAAAAKAAIVALLDEYLASRDAAEAQRRLRELSLPFYCHEAVKRACLLALERAADAPAALLALLATLHDSGAVSATQLAAGFARAAEAVDDLALDVPDAKRRWADLAAAAAAQGLLRTPPAASA